MLSAEGLTAICKLLSLIQLTAQWPSQVTLLIFFLIQKTEGGSRPIALLPTLGRVWEALCASDVGCWDMAHSRPYEWSTKGKAAEQAVWEVALADEAMVGSDQHALMLLTDLVKAYENICLRILMLMAVLWEFPTGQLGWPSTCTQRRG